MREIYTLCGECLVWLGESTPEAEIVIDAIPRISRYIELYGASQVWDIEGIAIGSPGILDSPLFKGLVNIFSRSWFKRVWTFQEAVLPLEVSFLCGSKVMTFYDVKILAGPLLKHFTTLQHFYPEADLGTQY